jgi:hypothetical protein
MSAMADTAIRPRQDLKRPAIFSAGVFLAGKASGLMNLGFSIAGIISPAMAGVIIDVSGSHVAVRRIDGAAAAWCGACLPDAT